MEEFYQAKLRVARHHLGVGLWLFLERKAIYTAMISAVHGLEICEKLNDNNGFDRKLPPASDERPVAGKYWVKIRNGFSNAFKHVDIDNALKHVDNRKGSLRLDDVDLIEQVSFNDVADRLYAGWCEYFVLTLNKPIEVHVFIPWYHATYMKKGDHLELDKACSQYFTYIWLCATEAMKHQRLLRKIEECRELYDFSNDPYVEKQNLLL